MFLTAVKICIFIVMKKALLIIPTTLLLASCVNSRFSGSRKGSVSSYYSGHIECKYDLSDGSEIFEFEVTKEQALTIKCSITTKSGEINFSICPKGENSLFARSTTENNEYSVDLPDYGNYKITVNTNSHSGGYVFDWAK